MNMIVVWPNPRSVNDYMWAREHVAFFFIIITVWKSVVRI